MTWKQVAEKVAPRDAASISEQDLESAGDAFLDWFGCAIAGAQYGAGLEGVLTGLAATPSTQPWATLVGTGTATSVLDAVLANSIAGRALNLDDRFEPGDLAAGAAVIPAALALAERHGLSGRELLAAIVVGFKIVAGLAIEPAPGCAVCAAGKVEACGAAAAGARLLGFDVATAARALQRAYFQPVAPPALSGVLAACAATAVPAVSPDISAADFTLAGGSCAPGAPVLLTSRMRERHVRLHAAAPHTHAAIDAALALKNAYRIHPEDLEAIEVHTYAQAAAEGADLAPETSYALRQSIPYCLAMVFLRGQVRPAELKPRYLLKAPVGWVMANTAVCENPEFTAAFPRARPALVVVRTRYGSTYEQTVLHPRGSPQNPLAPAELREKFMSLAAPVLGVGHAECLVRRLQNLSELSDVRELFAGLCKQTPEALA